ncbi:MAG: 2-oxo acid dehydrogenase subunit E2 [Bryobacterales bacterium]|nr:2-oxo acid dehydrogenase subunit E2 [Bryobacterales bacterium]
MPVQLTMPKLGLTMTEGVLSRWVAREGQEISKGQMLFEVETDKLVMEVEAEAGGVLHIAAEEGTTVPVLGVVGYLLTPGEEPAQIVSSPKDLPGDDFRTEITPPAPPPAEPIQRRLVSPAARRRARELGADIDQVPPATPDGRVTVADVEAHAAQAGKAPEPIRVPVSGARRVIAERMLASSQHTAPVTLTSEVDAGELAGLRERLRTQLGIPISYNAMLVRIAARCLEEFPYVNARQEGEAVILLPEISIGVAVDTARGLLAPVVRNAERKSLAKIARELDRLAQAAIAGKSQPEDFQGRTFTITNLGSLGVDAFTPIINLPEIAILGVGRIQQKPVAWESGIALRHRLTLSLTFDHRLIDGAPAARFLKRLAELVEKPALLEWESD